MFPLEMYTAYADHLGDVVGLRFLRAFSSYFIYIAPAAWALTFLGLLVSLTKMLTAVSFRFADRGRTCGTILSGCEGRI